MNAGMNLNGEYWSSPKRISCRCSAFAEDCRWQMYTLEGRSFRIFLPLVILITPVIRIKTGITRLRWTGKVSFGKSRDQRKEKSIAHIIRARSLWGKD